MTQVNGKRNYKHAYKLQKASGETNGSEGCMPLHRDDCPLEGAVSCVSASGGSICGGFYGHAGAHVIRCQEKFK